MKLNLGCGEHILKDFVNIDIRPFKGCICADVMHLPIKDNSVDLILANDIYEHVSFTKSKELLKHWVGKLKKGGQLYIQAPCIDRILQYYQENLNSIEAIEKTIECLFGKQDYPENTHYTICNQLLMGHYLKEAGIEGEIQFRLDNTNIMFRAMK